MKKILVIFSMLIGLSLMAHSNNLNHEVDSLIIDILEYYNCNPNNGNLRNEIKIDFPNFEKVFYCFEELNESNYKTKIQECIYLVRNLFYPKTILSEDKSLNVKVEKIYSKLKKKYSIDNKNNIVNEGEIGEFTIIEKEIDSIKGVNASFIKRIDSIKEANTSIKKANASIRETNNRLNYKVDSLEKIIKANNEGFFNYIVKKTSYFTVGLSLFALLSLFLLFKEILLRRKKNKHKKNRSIIKKTNDLKKKDVQKKPISKNPQTPADPIKAKSSVVPVNQFIISNLEGKYFFSEVLVTAGPRKDFKDSSREGDFGLGEDVAGIITTNKTAFFWLLDGTSNSNRLMVKHDKADIDIEIFSSRLLAQSIGWNIQKILNGDINKITTSERLLRQAIKETETEWSGVFNNLQESYKSKLINHIQQQGQLQCSTTVIVGRLNIDGSLDACQIGDSLIIAHNSSQQYKSSKGRQFVILKINVESGLKITFNPFEDTQFQNIKDENIQSLIAVTDGISIQTAEKLGKIKNFDFANPQIRQYLIKSEQKTEDDKAACIIQIKN